MVIIMNHIKRLVASVCVIALIWFGGSIVDTNANNMDSREYAPWNIFEMLSRVAQAKRVSTNKDMRDKNAKASEKLYSDENALLLARLIEAENGSAKHDETLVLTGVCVLKRVKSKSFPDTIRGVIYETGKWGRSYATAPELSGITPSTRAMEIAEELLIYGVDEYPDSLVFQSMFPQGRKTYRKIDGEYFCLE